MITRIAVLGPAKFVERLVQLEKELPTIRLDYYIYNNPLEASELVKNIKPCDAVFFSGSLPYIYAKEEREILPVPSHYLMQDDTSVATTLLSIWYSNSTPVEQISLDIIDPKLVESVLQDIDQTKQYPHMMTINPSFQLEEVVSFHMNLQRTGITTLAITSIHAVYVALLEKNISVIQMIDPKNSIIKGIEDTRSLALLSKSESAKIAVGYVQITPNIAVTNQVLKKIADSIQATVIPVDDHLYTLFSTRGHVQSAIESDTIKNWFALFPSPIKLAFGYGKTVVEATQNAKDAMPYATENTAYLINEHKQLLGPFPNMQKQVDLKITHPKLVQIAKETTLSPANLSKVMQFSRSRSSIEFTAYDLEVYLQVSRRTTERILKKLVDHSYARIVGEEMTYQQGRPRALYEFNFPTY